MQRKTYYSKNSDVQLDTLAFFEYSEHYPHEQWTIGFAA
jgi:hypothetical protein